MRALLLGILLSATGVIAASAGAASPGALVPRISSSTYDLHATGSVSLDWSRKTGEVGKACSNWTDESGSSTTSFKSTRGRLIIVVSPNFPWRLETGLTALTKRQRVWKRRYGSANVNGCPGICAAGEAARAADYTCTPASPAPGPGTDDCGRRTTKAAVLPVGIETRPEDDQDLTELVWPKSPPSTLMVGAPEVTNAFRKCNVYDEGYLEAALPIRLDGSDVTAIKRLRPGRKTTFTQTKTNLDCKDPKETTATCSLDYTTTVTIKRIR